MSEATELVIAAIQKEERERIIGILNRPSPLLVAVLHYTADGTAAWFGEAFLAEYLKSISTPE